MWWQMSLYKSYFISCFDESADGVTILDNRENKLLKLLTILSRSSFSLINYYYLFALFVNKKSIFSQVDILIIICLPLQ